VDYDETFAPVARYSSIRSVVSIAAEMGWKIHQMDVKTAFLNGVLDQEVYVEQYWALWYMSKRLMCAA
jgi:hypothetical protein